MTAVSRNHSLAASPIVFVILFAVALALPLLRMTTIDILIVFAIYAALGVSWNWTAGFGGLLNLAHVGYYAIGAYCCAISVTFLGLHPLIGMLAGAAISAALAWAITALSFKLKVADLYFALLTLTLMEGLASICRGLENAYSLGGIQLPFGNNPLWLSFLDKTWYYYLLIGLTFSILAVQYVVMKSKYAYMILGARDSEPAASSLGVPVNRVLTVVAVASAVPAALVGSIVALSALHVSADSVFPFELLLSIIIATVIGGMGTLWGPLLGAAVVVLIQEVIRRTAGGVGIVGITDVVYGIMLIAIIVFVPGGILGLYQRTASRFVRTRISTQRTPA